MTRFLAAAALAAAVLVAAPARADFVTETHPIGTVAATDWNKAVAQQQGGPVAVGQAMAQQSPGGGVAIVPIPQGPPPKQYPVDLTPVTDQLLQVVLVVLGAIGTWAGKQGLTMLHLQNNALARQVVDQGMQKAVGAASVWLREEFAGKPWTVDAHNALVKNAGDFAVAHFPDALKRVGIEFDPKGGLTEASRAKLDDMVEARLGMLAVDAAKLAGHAHPVVTATTTPSAPQQGTGT